MEFCFKTFMEMADFGHDRDKHKPSIQGSSGMPEECPLKPINSEALMEALKRLPPVGSLMARWSWQDIMEWGDDVGAVKLDISPFGSYKIIARRKVHDLEGTERWICKGVLPLNEKPFAEQKEEVLAHHLYETVTKISNQQIEKPEVDCQIFERVCSGIMAKCRQKHPLVMLYRGSKKIHDHYFKVFFEYRGAGGDVAGSRRVNQFDINVQFDPKIGLIRCWACEITSPKGQNLWQISPSEWDEYFTPNQDKSEIIECVRTLLNTY